MKTGYATLKILTTSLIGLAYNYSTAQGNDDAYAPPLTPGLKYKVSYINNGTVKVYEPVLSKQQLHQLQALHGNQPYNRTLTPGEMNYSARYSFVMVPVKKLRHPAGSSDSGVTAVFMPSCFTIGYEGNYLLKNGCPSLVHTRLVFVNRYNGKQMVQHFYVNGYQYKPTFITNPPWKMVEAA